MGAPRAGVVVTGTEVLTGRVTDRNGPWLAERLRELGVDIAQTTIVGDRPEDLLAALRGMRDLGLDLVVTSGGLGPTEDDLTTRVVAEFQERPMVLDTALEGRIAKILEPARQRWGLKLDEAAMQAGITKQAHVPEGAEVLEPVGTAPGVVVAPAAGGAPLVVVLPGPPKELQPMWADAVRSQGMLGLLAGVDELRQEMVRIFGIPESEIAETLRRAREGGIDIDALEITTCLRRGEVEVVTRFAPDRASIYDALTALIRERHGDMVFSEDGSSVDALVARLLGERGETIAVCESCTGGLMAGRLTELAGSSAYVAGGVTAYSNAAKVALCGVDPALIETHGAVSVEVAEALADGALAQFGADVGIGITGIAGPGGGTEEKPVGLVCQSVVHRDGRRLTVSPVLPGDRGMIRDRTTTNVLHLVRRILQGEG